MDVYKNMKVHDYFCGTKSLSKVAKLRNHTVTSLDNNPFHNADYIIDIFKTKANLGYADYAHFSPPCTAFSVASIGKHWTGGKEAYIPNTLTAIEGINILHRIAWLIWKNNYKYWTIENPRGVMRKILPKILEDMNIKYKIVTISYCQYGDTRMKPTDFFTNIVNWEGKMCKNGASCHVATPRGSKTGTQGLKNAIERGVIPPKVFEEIFNIIEREL